MGGVGKAFKRSASEDSGLLFFIPVLAGEVSVPGRNNGESWIAEGAVGISGAQLLPWRERGLLPGTVPWGGK